MKYAHIDTNGKILGWYSNDIHTDIPTPNIEVDEKTYMKVREEKLNAYDEVSKTFIIKDFTTQEQIVNNQILEHEVYLSSTDWITAKYNDEVVILENITKADFVAKYQDVYSSRQKARDEINRLEQELESL